MSKETKMLSTKNQKIKKSKIKIARLIVHVKATEICYS